MKRVLDTTVTGLHSGLVVTRRQTVFADMIGSVVEWYAWDAYRAVPVPPATNVDSKVGHAC